jgi:hypothetical protein
MKINELTLCHKLIQHALGESVGDRLHVILRVHIEGLKSYSILEICSSVVCLCGYKLIFGSILKRVMK